MLRNALTIIACLAALLAATARAAVAATGRCHHVRGDHVIARSGKAVVIEQFSTLRDEDGERYGRQQAIVGCAQSTGRRSLITTLETLDDDGGQRLVGLKLAGSRVAYVAHASSRYGSAISISGGDAIRPRSADQVPYINYDDETNSIPGWAVADDGAVAWIVRDPTGHDVLRLRRPGGDMRIVDLGFDLRLPVFADRVLRWRHGAAVRSLPLSP